MKKKSQTLQDRQASQAQLIKAYYVCFNSSDGKRVLEDLEKRFYKVDLTANTETNSMVKVGRHNVVYYINRLLVAGETNE